MKAHNLKATQRKNRKRAGRGISAGRGKTAGRGTKGQRSRSGGNLKPWFEGGQNPLVIRIPKLPGFTSRRPKAQTVTLSAIDRLSEKEVDAFLLASKKIIKSAYRPIKIVATGKITKAKTIKASGASKTAMDLISKAGGKFVLVDVPKRGSKSVKQVSKEG